MRLIGWRVRKDCFDFDLILVLVLNLVLNLDFQ